MRDVIDDLEAWWRSGVSVGMGTVVGTWKSSPRQPGASMLVGPDGTAVGSVSGGCVEGALYELGEQARDTGTPVLQRYGVSDDDAFAVGLTCGGIIDIFVEQVNQSTFPELGDIADDIREGRPVAVATLIKDIDGGRRTGRRLVLQDGIATGSLGSERLDAAVHDDVVGMLEQGRTGIVRYGPDGERRGDDISVFVASLRPPPAHDRVRCDRLRGGRRANRCVPRLPRHGLRRAADLRRPPSASPTPTRWSSTGPIAICRRRTRATTSIRAPWCACSPTTRSSMCRSSRWRCVSRSPTWGRWVRVGRTTIAKRDCENSA